jgi:DNA-binding NarL/FixJ family response regulator
MAGPNPCRLRIVVADDHAIVRAGLERLLEREPEMCICATASSGTETLERLDECDCDILLLDLSMPAPSGPELIGRVRRRKPRLPILVMSMHTDPTIVKAALQAGAAGYISKGSDPECVVQAVQVVAGGGHYVEPRLMHWTLFPPESAAATQPLSAREREVLLHLAAGESNSVIARKLFLSEKTVSSHKAKIMAKLNVASLAELIRYADQHLPDLTPPK